MSATRWTSCARAWSSRGGGRGGGEPAATGGRRRRRSVGEGEAAEEGRWTRLWRRFPAQVGKSCPVTGAGRLRGW